MKQIIGMISLCLLVLQTMAQESCSKGKIENYKGGCVLVIHTSQKGQTEDTIKVNLDGMFEYQFSVNLPGRAYITCVEEAASVPLFIVKGMKAELDIAFHQENYLCFQYCALPVVRGNASTSLILLIPVMYIIRRSNPSPKPACLTPP